jgi:hypothetical protein
MANYLLVYSGGSGMAATDAERKAILDDWTNWFTKLGPAVVDGGNPTSPVGKTVASNGKVRTVAPEAMITGYSIVKADSLDAAVEMAKSCPVLKSQGEISVFETFNAM